MNRDTQLQFTELYETHQGWLANFLRKRLNCSHKAADLMQDTYLKVLVSGKVPPTEYARQYLTRIAKGLVVDQYRRWRIEQAYLESISHLPEEYHASPEKRFEVMETLIHIDTLLHKVPEKARQAFLLRKLEGLSYSEISLELGVTISSVEKYIAKALQACTLAMLER
ncbi:sigma-70 family RNA polymerase sigma factor [Marinomonas sp.]|uniref:sigma-70 family RNA polymerase sigma factor n=1 Tax=Marinomonas sp. TaxID=1904862 RepID=UPI003A951B6F